MSHLIDIFLQPSKVFADLREKPTFVLPLLVIAVLSAAMTLAYFLRVDPDWFLDQATLAMSASDAAQAREMMPGARTMGYIGAISSPLVIVVIMALTALYYLLAGKVTGNAVSFKHGMSLASWASMPAVLGTLVALIGALMMDPQTSLESLMLANVDPLLVQLPADSPWSALARSFSLLVFWSLFLTALGWRIWGKTSWLQAIVVAALPSVLIYGGMAVFALLK
ncbi:YIP1 family protein [Lysobacter sp. A286]